MPYYEGTTPEVYPEIVNDLAEQDTSPTRGGDTREMISVTVRSNNPHERLMIRPQANWAFGLQESWAYWTGKNTGHVERYNPNMEQFMYQRDDEDEKKLHGSAYGRYLRRMPHDQIDRVIDQLNSNPATRQAIINIHNSAYEDYDERDVACTVYLNFFIRDAELNLISTMRSQDMLFGYPYDVQAFQWIQCVIAGLLNVDVGFFEHRMDNCHYYMEREEQTLESADECEGFTLPDCKLPSFEMNLVERGMGAGLVRARAGKIPDKEIEFLDGVDSFYGDWLRTMTAYEQSKFHDGEQVAIDIKRTIDVEAFDAYLQKVLTP